MQTREFIAKLLKTDPVDLEDLNRNINDSIESTMDDGNPRGHMQLIISMEELSELQKELSKELRGKGNHYDILQELADVSLCLHYVQNICEISDDDLNRAINVKNHHLNEILQKGVYS